MTDETAKGEESDWRSYWARQDAWSAAELAMLCCGWDPRLRDHHKQQHRYNETLETISRAVRVSALAPVDLNWPDTAAEKIYAATPLLKPRDAVSWAAKHFPDFPFADTDFEGDAVDTRERTSLLVIIAVLCKIADVDFSHPAKAAGIVELRAKDLGVSIGKRTIEGHFRRSPTRLSGEK